MGSGTGASLSDTAAVVTAKLLRNGPEAQASLSPVFRWRWGSAPPFLRPPRLVPKHAVAEAGKVPDGTRNDLATGFKKPQTATESAPYGRAGAVTPQRRRIAPGSDSASVDCEHRLKAQCLPIGCGEGGAGQLQRVLWDSGRVPCRLPNVSKTSAESRGLGRCQRTDPWRQAVGDSSSWSHKSCAIANLEARFLEFESLPHLHHAGEGMPTIARSAKVGLFIPFELRMASHPLLVSPPTPGAFVRDITDIIGINAL